MRFLSDSSKYFCRILDSLQRERFLLNLARSRISPDIMQVIGTVLARYIGRNHEQVTSHKGLERTIRRLHQIKGDRKEHLLYVKNKEFPKNLPNFFSQELENH